MTSYSGDIIKLAPVAATYEIEIERIVQNGRYGVFPLVITDFNTDEFGVFNIEDACFSLFYLITYEDVAEVDDLTNYIVEYLNSDTGQIECPTFTERFSIDAPSGIIILTTKNYGTEDELFPAVGTNFYPDPAVSFVMLTSQEYGYVEPLPEIKEKINSPNTFVDKYGKLHIGKDLQAGDVIKVKSISTYINPSGETETLEDTRSVVVI